MYGIVRMKNIFFFTLTIYWRRARKGHVRGEKASLIIFGVQHVHGL